VLDKESFRPFSREQVYAGISDTVFWPSDQNILPYRVGVGSYSAVNTACLNIKNLCLLTL
jgi:hypothetical protein